MIIEKSPISLVERQTGTLVDGELWDQITEKQLTDWEAKWVPEISAALKQLNTGEIYSSPRPINRNWNWQQKATTFQGLLACPGFSVVCEGTTQGLMVVNTVSYRCRIPEQSKNHLVYVEFLENAPWNRKDLFLSPRFRGVGSILICAAIELSREEGFKGRIGLHSLPQSEQWYINICRMTDLGRDVSKQNLRYFEMTPAQASAFIERGDES